ncbi:PH domain-containing protein [Amycolatopsis kentuckyensis]|uniref:PH domain-containing protein n=1 Tax=Amycolatopsis kentuckyensis TaxID=218823 RepID=UPI00356609EA
MSAGEIDLLPGERVLWAGEPVQRPLYVAADGVIAPAGLILAVAALWFLLVKQPSGGAMAGAVVVLVLGLYGAVGRQAVRYLALGRTTYAVTDSRIIARSGLFRQKERSSELAGLSAPVLKPGRSSTGTIGFGEPGSVTLMGVGEPKRVRDLLTKAIDEAKARQAPPEADNSAA